MCTLFSEMKLSTNLDQYTQKRKDKNKNNITIKIGKSNTATVHVIHEHEQLTFRP